MLLWLAIGPRFLPFWPENNIHLVSLGLDNQIGMKVI